MMSPGADYIRAMAQDPKTIRFNNAADPNRLTRFEKNVAKAAADGGEVIRQLADAFSRYVEHHGHSPAWPVDLLPVETPKPNVVQMRTPKKKR